MWLNKVILGLVVTSFAFVASSKCPSAPQGTTKLVCYYEGRAAVGEVDTCGCTHLVYAGPARGKDLEALSKKMLEKRQKLKFLLRTSGKDKDLASLIKSSTIHGVDLYDAHRDLNRTRITESVETLRTLIGSEAVLMLTVPPQAELLAKYYDLKSLVKPVTMFSVETHFLGEVESETFHPSRLSGVWDMMNTDSVVDLAIGLGVPAAKIVVTAPARAYAFQLANSTLSTPGSPAEGLKPRALNQKELCEEMGKDKWTLERDQDLSAPYAFKDKQWLAFEDASSLDVKGKYARIRGLAGLALVAIDDDQETKCGPSLLRSMLKGLGTQARAPRGAVLSYLENEILSVPRSTRNVDSVQLSPYRISRIVDSDGVIHAIREDTRTEFECQRQGYFVHPRSCNRFYRCVKFDQLSDEFTVFEFDCPAGLAFDSRYEVCVWPGSLHEGQACPGSSEIAPVPPTRFVCPDKPGYYADPANCRWFFACLDHGKSPFSAYEFRCPFGLGFDESKLICDWPWLVPGCGNLGKYESSHHGHSSSVLTGASAYIGTSADAVNVAAHQSLVSGASSSNLLGIQNGYGARQHAAGQGYVAQDHNLNLQGISQQYAAEGGQDNGQIYHTGQVGVYSNGEYNSGAEILGGFSGQYNGDGASSISHGSASINHGASLAHGGGLINQGALLVDQGSSISHGAGLVNQGALLVNQGSSFGHGSASINHGSSFAHGGSSINQGALLINQGSSIDHGSASFNQGSSIGHGSASINQLSSFGHGSGAINQGTSFGHGLSSNGQGSSSINYGSSSISRNSYPVNHGSSGAYAVAGEGHTSGEVLLGVSRDGGYSHQSQGISQGGVINGGGNYGKSYSVGGGVSTSSFTLGGGAGGDDHSGKYVHDATGDSAVPYQHDDQPAVPYNHVEGAAGKYAESSGVYIDGDSGSYKQGQYSSVYSQGSDSGAYNQGKDSGAYKQGLDSSVYSQGKYSSVYKQGQDSGVYSQGQDSGAYKQGQYAGDSNSYAGVTNSAGYQHDNSGAYKSTYQYAGIQQGQGYQSTSGNNVYVDHGSTNDYSDQGSAYIRGSNQYNGYAATGAAHTLTAGAINSGLVGKTTLVDAELLQNNAYSHSAGATVQSFGNTGSGYSNGQYSTVTAAPVVYHQPESVSYAPTGQSYSSVKSVSNSNNYQTYQPSVTPTPIVSYQQPISVSTYRPALVVSQPKTEITQVFGYQKPAVSYVQPIVTVSSTPKPVVYEKQSYIVQQPAIAISSYSKPSVSVHNQQTYHGQNEYQKYETRPSIVSVPQTPVTHYESQSYVSSTPKSVISYQNAADVSYQSISTGPTVSAVPTYVQQPTYAQQSTVSTFTKPALSTYTYNQDVTPSQDNHYVHQVQEKYVQKPVVQEYTVQQQNTYVQPAVSKQEFHQSTSSQQYNTGKYIHPVVSTQRPVAYEQTNVVGYSQQNNVEFKGPEYLPPISTVQTPTPIKYSQQSVHTYVAPKVVVSSTPSYEAYSQTDYQHTQPQNTYTYKQQYVAPKVTYPQASYVSSTPSSVEYKQQSIVHTYEAPKVYTPVVSSTPKSFLEYVQPQKSYTYQQKEYVAPTVSYVQPAYVSSTPAPIKYQQETVVHTYDAPKFVAPVVSSTPAYVQYKKPAVQQSYSYNSQEYNTAKSQYVQPAITVSSTPAPVTYQQTYTYQAPKVQSYESSQYYSQQPNIQVSTPTPFVQYQKPVEYKAPKVISLFEIKYEQPAYVSSTTEGQKYQQYENVQTYETPKVQYQPTTYQPSTYKYTQAKFSTVKPTESYEYTGPEYLPPTGAAKIDIRYSPVKYVSTPAPSYQEDVSYNVNPIQEFAFEKLAVTPKPRVIYKQPAVIQQTYRPVVVTSQRPVTTYQKPQLTVDYTNQNEQNQVNLLGFGTVGPNAGLVTSTGSYHSEEEAYVTPATQRIIKVKKIVRPSYATVTESQRLVEVTPPVIRKSRPKIAVVTKVNDFNPLLIRKLGAVCSCRSNVLKLRNQPEQQYEVEYDYEVPVNGDDDEEWTYKNEAYSTYTPSAAPVKSASPTVVAYVPERSTSPIVIRKPKITVVSSTLSPIVVPDYSNSYDEEVKPEFGTIVVNDEQKYDVISSSSQAPSRRLRLKSRAKSLAPTVETILIPRNQSPVAVKAEKTYDRYGLGVECKREGLFRHPNNCNKFYSCRWDCSKNKFTLHTFSCPIQLSFDSSMGACNWPSQGPACQGDTLLPSGF